MVRVDVQTRSPGIEFYAAWQRRQVMEYDREKFGVLCLDDLLAAKKAAGRKVDLEDIRILELRRSNPS